MNQSRYAAQVGVFVVIGLALIALLILNFSQGITLFQQTYELHIIMPTSAGLKPAADVMMAGVPIGKVIRPELRPDGRSVTINSTILGRYKIRTNAVFSVKSLGFLGDQYVEVTPAISEAPYLKDGDTVEGVAPFDMLQALQSTAGLLDQARKTVKDLDQAITNINRTILSDQTLYDFSLAISNFASVTGIAIKTVQGADDLVASNTPAITAMVTNLEAVSEKFNIMADQLDQIVVTNRGDINDAVKNLRDTTASFKQLAAGLEAGNGLAGSLLKDETMKAQAASLLSNANSVAVQFADFGSNLNKNGIWRSLWKPKPEEKKSSTTH
ncbi:MAG TPA: MlaD family protein [Verrucomicrobiae bacterium]|jgi:phospholipid/cholesterol/gamma-HCH transport system substrate-binding protein